MLVCHTCLRQKSQSFVSLFESKQREKIGEEEKEKTVCFVLFLELGRIRNLGTISFLEKLVCLST